MRSIEEIEQVIIDRTKDDVMFINGSDDCWMPMGYASSSIRKALHDPTANVFCDGRIVRIEHEGVIWFIE